LFGLSIAELHHDADLVGRLGATGPNAYQSGEDQDHSYCEVADFNHWALFDALGRV